jgi:hypothetical protein
MGQFHYKNDVSPFDQILTEQDFGISIRSGTISLDILVF